MVILNAPTQVEIYGYYDRGRHVAVPLPIGRPVDEAATREALAQVLERYRDLYAILWATDESDPAGLVLAALDDGRHARFDEQGDDHEDRLAGGHERQGHRALRLLRLERSGAAVA